VVELFVGAILSLLMDIILFGSSFVFALLVLTHVGTAMVLHNWTQDMGPAPWASLALSPCFVCMVLGYVKGQAIFTRREF